MKIPLAYAMARDQHELKTLVDTWISMERSQGTIAALFEHWILGRPAESAKPRWSVLNDVLRGGRASKSPHEPGNAAD